MEYMAEITSLRVQDTAPFPLPEKRIPFPLPKPREHQEQALRLIKGAFDAGYQTVILEAPTGFGKSAIAIGLVQEFAERKQKSYIAVSSKYLQDQYVSDFDSVTVKGRGNFSCKQKKEHSCRSAPAGGFKCRHVPNSAKGDDKKIVGHSDKRGTLYLENGTTICPYWRQKCTALDHSYPIVNYDYLFSETQFVGDFGIRNLVICDEAHAIEGKIMQFVSLDMTSQTIEPLGGQIPKQHVSISTWERALGEWSLLFKKQIDIMENKKEQLTPPQIEKMEDYKVKMAKCDSVRTELQENPNLWVVSAKEEWDKRRSFTRVTFRPIEVGKWGEMLFSLGSHFLLQSATIINPQTLVRSLGIKGRVLYLQVPSTFPPERRLFQYQGVGKMSRANKEETIPKMIEAIEKIIAENPTTKGVIHTHSYAIMRDIMNRIQNPRFIFNDSSSSRDRTFAAS